MSSQLKRSTGGPRNKVSKLWEYWFGGRGGETKFEMSADFMIQQHIRRRCFSSTGFEEILCFNASKRAINSKWRAISVERIVSSINLRTLSPSSSTNNCGHRSSTILEIVRQCRFSSTERSLKSKAREDFEAVRKAFVTPG